MAAAEPTRPREEAADTLPGRLMDRATVDSTPIAVLVMVGVAGRVLRLAVGVLVAPDALVAGALGEEAPVPDALVAVVGAGEAAIDARGEAAPVPVALVAVVGVGEVATVRDTLTAALGVAETPTGTDVGLELRIA